MRRLHYTGADVLGASTDPHEDIGVAVEDTPPYVFWQIGIAALGVVVTAIGIFLNRRRR